MVDCALCLFVSAGCHAYEFLRINLLDVLSNLTTIQTKLAKEEFRALKGKFRYDDRNKHMATVNSKFANCAEDCISVVRKIIYDVRSNSFVGFTSPLDESGISQMKDFRTDCIEDFKHCCQQ